MFNKHAINSLRCLATAQNTVNLLNKHATNSQIHCVFRAIGTATQTHGSAFYMAFELEVSAGIL